MSDPEAEARQAKDLERALVRAAQAGDTAAFEELARRVRDRVFWVARQVVGNAEEARDVAQNVLLRLWQSLDKYDERYAFSTWLYRMTVNLAIDSLRRGASARREVDLDLMLVPAAPDATGRTTSPEEAAADREVGRIFDELKETLPPQQRAVFALREIEGLSSEEVAEVLGLSASTVRNHLFQARRTLKGELERRYPEYLPRGRKT